MSGKEKILLNTTMELSGTGDENKNKQDNLPPRSIHANKGGKHIWRVRRGGGGVNGVKMTEKWHEDLLPDKIKQY